MGALDGVVYDDGVYRREWKAQASEDRLYSVLTQPNEHKVFEWNAELRKDPDAARKAQIAGKHYVGEIPKILLDKWTREDPDMRGDPKTRSMALLRHIKANPECLAGRKGDLRHIKLQTHFATAGLNIGPRNRKQYAVLPG